VPTLGDSTVIGGEPRRGRSGGHFAGSVCLMAETSVVQFDMSTRSWGPFYGQGVLVKQDKEVCRGVKVQKRSGTRAEACF